MECAFTNHGLVSSAIDAIVRPTITQIIKMRGGYVGQRQVDVHNFKYFSPDYNPEIGVETEGPLWGV